MTTDWLSYGNRVVLGYFQQKFLFCLNMSQHKENSHPIRYNGFMYWAVQDVQALYTHRLMQNSRHGSEKINGKHTEVCLYLVFYANNAYVTYVTDVMGDGIMIPWIHNLLLELCIKYNIHNAWSIMY
jgi:hypothetical protein